MTQHEPPLAGQRLGVAGKQAVDTRHQRLSAVLVQAVVATVEDALEQRPTEPVARMLTDRSASEEALGLTQIG